MPFRSLDVNVGAPLVDEALMLPELTQKLVARLAVPLSLDSSNAEAIANALPYCPGSPLVNSISGEGDRMDVLGPLCRDYGAPFILLPLQGAKLPVTAAERIAITETLLRRAEDLGIPRRLIMVDILALAISSKGDGGKHCLEMARWCRANNLPTTLGLSNISFGLPALIIGDHVAQRDAVHDFVHAVLHLLKDKARGTSAGFFTGVFKFQAIRHTQFAFKRADDHADRDVFGFCGKRVAALRASCGNHQLLFSQRRHQLFEIGLRDILPFGNGLERLRFIVSHESQVIHGVYTIACAGGKFH